MRLLDNPEAFVSLVRDLDREVASLDDASLDEEWLPSSVIVPMHVYAGDLGQPMLFCPKVDILHDASVVLGGYTLVGRFGVVTDAERLLLERTRAGAPLFFVGDLDPMDLTTFLALGGAAGQVHYVGLGGDIFERINASDDGVRSIPMTAFERWHWDKLQGACPKLRALVGEPAASLLDRRCKLELEGALHSPRRASFTRHMEAALAERSASSVET